MWKIICRAPLRLLPRPGPLHNRHAARHPDRNQKSPRARKSGFSGWIAVDQSRIDAFADATEDRQFIHTDPEAAARTQFGGTIAHGFLTLSLLSRMAAEAMLVPEGLTMAVNYGLDRVRFLAPVTLGQPRARPLHP